MKGDKGDQPKPAGLTSRPMARIGPLQVDVPRSIGYFGAIALAIAFEVIEPPIGIFIAAVPFFKLLEQRREPKPVQFVGAVLEGAAQPVGGNAEAIIKVAPDQQSNASKSPGEQSSASSET